MRLLWTERARDHLAALHGYIAGEDPAAADRALLRILDLTETVLVEHPRGGRPGRVAGTRELVITGTPYIVAYEIVGDAITVLAVLHGARRWPGAFY